MGFGFIKYYQTKKLCFSTFDLEFSLLVWSLGRANMWIFGRKGASGFSASSTAEDVTEGINGTGLTAIITGNLQCFWTSLSRMQFVLLLQDISHGFFLIFGFMNHNLELNTNFNE